MICKDCFHYELCQHYRDSGEYFEWTVEKFGCKRFKEKSQFVELPCPIGSTIYKVYDNYVCNTYINCDCCITEEDVADHYFNKTCECCKYSPFIEEYKNVDAAMIVLNMEDFGKSVFLTREEAETALAASIERIEKVRNKE